METIADLLDVSKVNLIHRIKPSYTEEAFEVRSVKRESCEKLITYLSKYPLFSSKYLGSNKKVILINLKYIKL